MRCNRFGWISMQRGVTEWIDLFAFPEPTTPDASGLTRVTRERERESWGSRPGVDSKEKTKEPYRFPSESRAAMQKSIT